MARHSDSAKDEIHTKGRTYGGNRTEANTAGYHVGARPDQPRGTATEPPPAEGWHPGR